jgi:hypothetical protein
MFFFRFLFEVALALQLLYRRCYLIVHLLLFFKNIIMKYFLFHNFFYNQTFISWLLFLLIVKCQYMERPLFFWWTFRNIYNLYQGKWHLLKIRKCYHECFAKCCIGTLLSINRIKFKSFLVHLGVLYLQFWTHLG